MKFSDIKNDIIAPKKQRIIDRKILIEGHTYHILSAYEECDKVKILVLNIGDMLHENMVESKTIREDLFLQANNSQEKYINVHEVYLDDKKMPMSSASGGGLLGNHYDYFKLSYIASLGIDLGYLDDVLLSNIIVTTYEFDDVTLETLGLENFENLRITRIPNFENTLVNVDFNITLNKQEYWFKDKTGEEHRFTARLREVDIWGELVPKVEENFREFYENLDDEEKELHSYDEVTSSYEQICPKGKNLLCVAYESENQLNFYTKQYLDLEIEKNTQASILFLGRDDETGERFSILEPVEKASVESIKVELFTLVKMIEFDDITVDLKL